MLKSSLRARYIHVKCSCEARGRMNVTMRDRFTIPTRGCRPRVANIGQVVTRNLIQTPYINNVNANAMQHCVKCVRI